jgi:O-antigen/teichoic acid export membrane protein
MTTSPQLEEQIVVSGPVPSLRANFGWTFAGNVIYAFGQWGIVSVLAKFGNTTTVGQFALAVAVVSPVFMFSNLQLRSLQATDVRSEYSFTDYFILRLVSTLVGLLAVTGLIFGLPFDSTTKPIVELGALMKAIEGISDVVAGLLQLAEKLKRASISLIFRGLASFVIFGLVFYEWRSIVWAMISLIVGWSIVLCFYDLRWAISMIGGLGNLLKAKRQSLVRLFVASLPLGLVMMLISLNANIPRYVLEGYLGSGDLGIFASLAYLLVSINLVVNSLGQSASTRLSWMFAQSEVREFRVLVSKLVSIGAAIIVIGVPAALWLGRPLLSLLYRPEYGNHVDLLVLMVVAAGFNAMASFLGFGMTSARSFILQIPVMIVSTLIAGLGSVFLVPRYGLTGAALALLASAVVLFIGYGLALFAVLNRAVRASI